MSRSIEIVEVGPRDGLQSEPGVVPTAAKVEFIERLIDSGLKRVEVTSFVNPKKVPQMADAEQVLAGLRRREGVSYIGLVLNRKGYDRAVAAGCNEIGMAVVASDTFNRRNQGQHGRKRHLERRAKQRCRVQQHDYRRSPSKAPQRYRLPPGQNGQCHQAGHGKAALHGHLRAGQQHVKAPGKQGATSRQQLTRHAQCQRAIQRCQQARHPEGHAHHNRDMQAGDRENMREARIAHGIQISPWNNALATGQQRG